MELLHQSEDIIAQRYRIIEILGQGGSGTTYLAEDLKSSEKVALKALSLHRMTDWKMMELFEREAKILSQLHHPAIPCYLEYFHVDTPEDRSFYIAQQLAQGKSLATLVESGWRTTENEVHNIAIQILEILVYLHSLTPPVVHRDIKPQNIIRRDDGQVYLVDFGAVQDTYYTTFMRGSTVVGTYGYMAPEQFRGQAVPATDLYGVGANLLFLLTHRSPTELPTDGLKIDFRSRVEISEEFADWLEKMLEPDVEDRFTSAEEALALLRGKRMISPAVPPTWKTIIGVGIATIAAVAAVIALNSYKWAVLNNIGYKPPINICKNANAIRNYLNQSGNPNIVLTDNDFIYGGVQYTLWECAESLADKDLLEFLIAKHADINTGIGKVRSLKTAEFLIAKSANISAKDKDGTTPLHKALQFYKPDRAKLLIAKGADINAKDKDGKTPLHIAAQYSDKALVQLLLTKKANVNARDNAGNTPLHMTQYKQNAMELLLKSGADVNAKNSQSQTIFHLVVKNTVP